MMGAINDIFKNAISKMTGGASTESTSGYSTKKTNAEDVVVGNSFVDVNCAVYTIENIKINKGIICVYATTTSDNANGWFTRDTYNVVLDDTVNSA